MFDHFSAALKMLKLPQGSQQVNRDYRVFLNSLKDLQELRLSKQPKKKNPLS